MKPVYEYGFWWWYDPTRKGWFIGCAPYYGPPSWAVEPARGRVGWQLPDTDSLLTAAAKSITV